MVAKNKEIQQFIFKGQLFSKFLELPSFLERFSLNFASLYFFKKQDGKTADNLLTFNNCWTAKKFSNITGRPKNGKTLDHLVIFKHSFFSKKVLLRCE